MGSAVRKACILLVLALVWASMPPLAAGQSPLNSLRAIHALSNAQAGHQVPVAFEATVSYYRDYERTLFVQDGELAIYVQPRVPAHVAAGDRVLIEGTTHESFRPFVAATTIKLLGHEILPPAVPATYARLIRADLDCRLVTVRGTVRSADLVLSSDVPSISLQMRTDGGSIDAVIDSADIGSVKNLLDAEVEFTGVASGHFDGKMQVTGILLHASSLAAIKVIKPALKDPWDLPITGMDTVLSQYHVNNTSQRVRVHGTITYYQPGSTAVLQNGSKSIWIMTHASGPLQIGDEADAIGFPGLHDGFLTLTGGEILDRKVSSAVKPRSVTWTELATSHYLFDLVTTEGKIVAENRGSAQDEYILDSGGSLFSAVYRHPAPRSVNPGPPAPMKQIALGSKVRVTGICLMGASNPFDTQVPFDILMRTTDDIVAVAGPSWLNVGNLSRIIGVLLVVVLLVGAWGWTLLVKVKRQTATLTGHAEKVADHERHNAQLEAKRSRILEDINSSRPLPELIEAITEMLAFSLNCPFAWCEMTDGGTLGNAPGSQKGFRIMHLDVPARAGGSLGTLYAATEVGEPAHPEEPAMLEAGVRLATLAIETRKLYKDLVYRSEFDLLTDIYNRFSLDRYLEEQIDRAKVEHSIFGLVYIDLDEFKQVNDFYGHHVGDLYLHEVSMRMKRQLRTGDMLARLGGDEFAALVPVVRNRSALEEVSQRLERCFDAPFAVEGYVLRGGASVGVAMYPEDGTTADSLLSAADAAMYVNKHTKRHKTEMPGQLQQALFKPRR